MVTETVLPIKITGPALQEIKRLHSELEDPSGMFLRIGVKGGGCSGMSYLLTFDNAKDTDTMYDVEGLSMIMDKAHLMYVYGMEVDFGDGLNARGFTFTNPNAKETCGCGTSFSA
ncbi:MAG: iron-sulfur cluster assembly accessory protein [Flavobacteriales bacterium]|nr:iron-sulfur cluster assembly accessory protein [Flavobacteriales bacterium]